MNGTIITVLKIFMALLVVLAVGVGALLQQMTLQEQQKLSQQMHSQSVYILSSQLSQLLLEAETSLGRYNMSGDSTFAEKFNKANKALPKTLENLGNLGPFDGDEAETVSQLKQSMSESIMLLGQARALVGDTTAGARGLAMYRQMQAINEKIQALIARLLPAEGTRAFVDQCNAARDQEARLKQYTVIWLGITEILVLALILIMRLRVEND